MPAAFGSPPEAAGVGSKRVGLMRYGKVPALECRSADQYQEIRRDARDRK